MERVILGLGSNKGDKKGYLRKALDGLSVFLVDMSCSSVYRTSPQCYIFQDDFYNMVVVGFYDASPMDLLKRIHEIEFNNGRNRVDEIPKGPRTIDIDILFFGDLEFSTPELTIPHPAIKNRAFVLIPLLEIFPFFKDIDGECFYRDLLSSVADQMVERVFKF